MKAPRKFKCRNGSIVENDPKEKEISGGYGMTFRVISSTDKGHIKGEKIFLIPTDNGYPEGGACGKGWDVVEERK